MEHEMIKPDKSRRQVSTMDVGIKNICLRHTNYFGQQLDKRRLPVNLFDATEGGNSTFDSISVRVVL